MATQNLQQNPGFLAALGLDVDRDAILRGQAAQEKDRQLGLSDAAMQRGDYAIAGGLQGGAMLGEALTRKWGKPDVTPQEESMLKAKEESDRRMNEWYKNNPNATGEERDTMYYQIVAEESYRNGLPDVGGKAHDMLEEKKRYKEIQRLQLEEAGLKVQGEKAGIEAAQAQRDKFRGVGTYMPIWTFGETNPNRSRYAYIDPETGDATKGPGGEVIAPRGEYTTEAPDTGSGYGGGGGSGAGFGATNTEKGNVREAHAALYRRGATLNEMRDIMEEGFALTGDMVYAGGSGKLISSISRWANDISNVMGLAGGGEFTAVGKDGNEYSIDTPEGRRRLVLENRDIFKKYLPAQFKESAELSKRWSALMGELLYLEARAQENGAKQFSDHDIERMAGIVGEAINDPEALQKLILSSYDRAYNDIQYRMSMYPRTVRNGLVTDEARQALEEQYNTVRKRWGTPLVKGNEAEAYRNAGRGGKGGAPQVESDDEFLKRITGGR